MRWSSSDKYLKLRFMKNKVKYSITTIIRVLILVIVGTCFLRCTENFEMYNTDKTKLMEVTDYDLGALFSKALGSQFENLNYARGKGKISDHLSGFFTSGYQQNERNEIIATDITRIWATCYLDCLPSLDNILRLTKERNIAAHSIALIWKCFVMQRITDYWGPVPYLDAGTGKAVIQFDSQKDIYYYMINDLVNASSALTAELQNKPNLNVFGSADMLFKGDVGKWIKFANSLRLRMAIRISKVDPGKAKTEAEAAVAGGLMENNSDNAMLDVTQIVSGANGLSNMWAYFANIMSASMESLLMGYKDPRVGIYFNKVDPANIAESFPAEVKGNAGGYHGMSNGFESVHFAFFRAHSLVGDRWHDDNWNVTPINYMHSAEVWFLRAEGSWLGWNMGSGTMKEFYEKGIRNSISQWRPDLSSDSIQKFTNSTLLPIAPNNYPYYDPPMTDIPVKFSDNRDKQYEQIITQKWLSIYPESMEAWAEYRRTRLPKLYPKKNSTNGNVLVTKGMIITRLPYPDSEKNSQPDEIAKAVTLLGGPDKESTPLWWDVNKNGN